MNIIKVITIKDRTNRIKGSCLSSLMLSKGVYGKLLELKIVFFFFSYHF